MQTRPVGNLSVRMEFIAEGSRRDQDASMSVRSTASQDIVPSLEAESRKKKKKKRSARLREPEENRQRMEAARAAEPVNVGIQQGWPMSQ